MSSNDSITAARTAIQTAAATGEFRIALLYGQQRNHAPAFSLYVDCEQVLTSVDFQDWAGIDAIDQILAWAGLDPVQWDAEWEDLPNHPCKFGEMFCAWDLVVGTGKRTQRPDGDSDLPTLEEAAEAGDPEALAELAAQDERAEADEEALAHRNRVHGLVNHITDWERETGMRWEADTDEEREALAEMGRE